MVTHLVDTWWNTWWIVEVDVVVKFGPVVEFTGCPPGVPPGGMARSGPFSLYERTAFLSESGKAAFTARLLEWDNLASVKVDRVKLVAGGRRGADDVAEGPAAGFRAGKAGRCASRHDCKGAVRNVSGLTSTESRRALTFARVHASERSGHPAKVSRAWCH